MFELPNWLSNINFSYHYVMFFVIFFSSWFFDIWIDVIRSANGEKIDGWDTVMGFVLSFLFSAFISITWGIIWPLYIALILLVIIFVIVKKFSKAILLSGVRKK